jgi:hypothetical protein
MTADPGDETVSDDVDASDGGSGDCDGEVGSADADSDVDADGDADMWKFELDEVDEDGVVDDRETIEPGSPSLENSVFVLLGALVTIGIIVRVAMVFGV